MRERAEKHLVVAVTVHGFDGEMMGRESTRAVRRKRVVGGSIVGWWWDWIGCS